MTTGSRTRSDRLRLRDRLDLADRAIELLRSKEEALEREHVRLAELADRAETTWAQAYAEAADWGVRARMLGAGPDLRRAMAATDARATVEVGWRHAMGLEYADDVEVTPGRRPLVTTTAALVPTAAAYDRALRAGAERAALADAVRRVDRELADTRRRRRAIDEHLRPMLEERLHDVEMHLDEVDREEAGRVRIAVQRGDRP